VSGFLHSLEKGIAKQENPAVDFRVLPPNTAISGKLIRVQELIWRKKNSAY
jgi:hypothetical protein